MKVKVNIIKTWCSLMSEAVIVPSLTIVTVIVTEESLARDTYRHIATQTRSRFYVKFSK